MAGAVSKVPTANFVYVIIYSVLNIFPVLNSFAQQLDKKEFKKMFLDAEYYILYDTYDKALPIYLEIYNNDTYQANYNANLNYRIGQCYLKDPLYNYYAFPYLEKAVKNITFNYKTGSVNETQAPPDAFFSLGNAYRVIFEFDKAIYAYQKYEEYLEVSDLEQLEQVNRLIQSCRNAKDLLLLSEHNFVEITNLGLEVNSEYPEYNPVISSDETKLFFTSRRNYNLEKINITKKQTDQAAEEVIVDEGRFDEDIYFSKKVDGNWTKAKKITDMLEADYGTRCISLSHDGNILLLARDEVGTGNIEYTSLYISKWSNGKWSPMEKLNKNINTKGGETSGWFSADGKTLYFSSQREGGYGGADIYKSQLEADGEWGPAVNLGQTINTMFNEENPVMLKDNKTLFFCSQGHYNMGGFDIFYSKYVGENEWSTPINIGFPINTMEDDKFFSPVNDGTEGYIAMISLKGYGNEDIFRIKISSSLSVEKFSKQSINNLAEIQDEDRGDFTLQTKLKTKKINEKEAEAGFEFPLIEIDLQPDMTVNEIIRVCYEDVEKLLAKARELKKEADIAYLIAEEKIYLQKISKRKWSQFLLKHNLFRTKISVKLKY
ncbi:MAG: PD40 domain-containing protein [Bacteroidia bacterium]|nr:PD40 domain-containing protein [Bacteroidia bacterium]